MELQSPLENLRAIESSQPNSGRRELRYRISWRTDWDFFTNGTGTKTGFIPNISQSGMMLCTAEAVDHRRWLRLLVKQGESNIWFTAVGRVIRCENRIEAWSPNDITVYRYGIELIHPLNAASLQVIEEFAQAGCNACGSENATIPDPMDSHRVYCVLCHLRLACHNLLVQDN